MIDLTGPAPDAAIGGGTLDGSRWIGQHLPRGDHDGRKDPPADGGETKRRRSNAVGRLTRQRRINLRSLKIAHDCGNREGGLPRPSALAGLFSTYLQSLP
jgi:hypothetical protein